MKAVERRFPDRRNFVIIRSFPSTRFYKLVDDVLRKFTLPIMASKDPRIDAYIAKAAPFAQPILRHVRNLVHRGCPHVQETIKWSMPHFDYHGIMLGMAAFKEHCSIGFWKGELILGKRAGSDGGMGHFGKVTSLKNLPSDKRFIEYVRKAAALNKQGIKKPADLKPRSARSELTIPEYFRAT